MLAQKKASNQCAEISKSKVTICPATTHILNVGHNLKKQKSMKRIITILLITISTISFGQEVKKMKESKNYGKATFYVLKSDMKTKHGKYSIKGYTAVSYTHLTLPTTPYV